MSNKKIFKKLYSNKINKDYNYRTILKSIERHNINMKMNTIKWVIVPLCLIMVICGVVLLNKDNNGIIYKPSGPIISYEGNYEIYINSVECNKGLEKFDADVKTTNYVSIPYFKYITLLDYPDDFDNTEIWKVVWVKKDKNSKDYDILNHYERLAVNTKNNRKINISFSEEHKPLRDYYFGEEGSKTSRINDFELIIYKYENSYMTAFTYKGVNYDIETSHITEQELIDFLISLIR